MGIGHRAEPTASANRLFFAQITDLHIGFEQSNPFEANQRRLNDVLALLVAMDPRPAFVLATSSRAGRSKITNACAAASTRSPSPSTAASATTTSAAR